jgi:hypothetical protein
VPKTLDSEITRLASKYEQDEVLVRAIMKCESSMYPDVNHVNKNGTKDVGYFQINTVHWQRALNLGYDVVNDKWDNLEFGFLLLKEQGTRPWNASKSCWLPQGG